VDAGRFDALLRTLSAVPTRRAALRALAGATVAALGHAALGHAAGREVTGELVTECSPNGTRCGRISDLSCCSGRCVRKRGTRKKVCKQAPEQGICDIKFDACVGETGSTKDCGTLGGDDCKCTITASGYSRCTDFAAGSLNCMACTTDRECVDYAEENLHPRANTWKCISCTECPGTGAACAASCPTPCQPGGAC